LRKYHIDEIVRALVICLLITTIINATACSKATATNPNPELPPQLVEVIRVEQQNVPIYSEWIGTLDGMITAQIKSQVSGNILSTNYKEGSFVKKGDVLFQIDPRTFQVTLDQAKADLAKAEGQLAQANGQYQQTQAQVSEAEANLVKVELDLKRAEPLVKNGIIAQRDMDNTVQSYRANEAQVKSAKAAVETAKAGVMAAQSAVIAAKAAVQTAELNLSFTKITAPIDGIASIAQAQVGDYVNVINPNSPPLTTISVVDPIKAYFNVTEQEYLQNTKYSSGKNKESNESLQLEMILADGTVYPEKGKFYVADSKVDPKTGTIRMAGIFPNPGNILRPGQYARLRAVTSKKDDALLVPQRAVSELQGRFQIAVVTPDNKVELRTIKIGERTGSMYVVNEGLKAGETIVVEGTQKVKAGSTVVTKPFAPTEAAK
jgi:membrane fusion protein (multidrug efflux system)